MAAKQRKRRRVNWRRANHDSGRLRELTEFVVALREKIVEQAIIAMGGLACPDDDENVEGYREEEQAEAYEKLLKIMVIAMRLAQQERQILASPVFERFWRERNGGMSWEMPSREVCNDFAFGEPLRQFIADWRTCSVMCGWPWTSEHAKALSVILGQLHDDERLRELPNEGYPEF